MSYIRTKQGNIYEVKNTYLEYFNCIDKFGTMEGIQFHKSVVIKQADTIEELCDEFVALLFDDETIYECPLGYYTEIFNARTHCLQSLRKNYDINMIGVRAIYGAIWTDKGLIYVAKMNKKGELELL